MSQGTNSSRQVSDNVSGCFFSGTQCEVMGLSFCEDPHHHSLSHFDIIPDCDRRNLSQLVQRSTQQAMLTRCKNQYRWAHEPTIYTPPSFNRSLKLQESLSNAKVSARQLWYVGRNSLNRSPHLRTPSSINVIYIHRWKVLSVRNNFLFGWPWTAVSSKSSWGAAFWTIRYKQFIFMDLWIKYIFASFYDNSQRKIKRTTQKGRRKWSELMPCMSLKYHRHVPAPGHIFAVAGPIGHAIWNRALRLHMDVCSHFGIL